MPQGDAGSGAWESGLGGRIGRAITAAVLDRLLHHGHTVVLEGTSYRMKDRTEN